MPDLVEKYLPELKQHRLPGLDLGEGFIYPQYGGQSILNIPASICRLLGVPEIANQPLHSEYLAPLFAGGDVRRVVLVLMDALALHRLRRWMAAGSLPLWERTAETGVLAPLTSITPSTTSAALTTLWTGRSASEHGILGYEMWMKEYGVVANTILHAPITFQGSVGSLQRAGFDPKTYLPFPSLGEYLSAYGISSYALQHHAIIRSGLSQMFFNQLEPQSFSTAADLSINLRELLHEKRQERLFAWVYWGEVDHFSHHYGPDDERTEAEFVSFSANLERLFVERLDPGLQGDTVLILTADHGQIATRPDPHYDLKNHPSLTRRLHIQPTGENRLAYLFVRPGQTEAVREYIERSWPNQFAILESAYAVEHGLFGPGRPHPALFDRLGEYILVAKGSAYLWWSQKDNHLYGRHGGLHPEEMLVPFLAARL